MTLDSSSNIPKISFMAYNPNSSYCFDGGCSYFGTMIGYMCILKQRFQITYMTLESKVKVKYT